MLYHLQMENIVASVSSVYSMYNTDPTTLLCAIPAFNKFNKLYAVSSADVNIVAYSIFSV